MFDKCRHCVWFHVLMMRPHFVRIFWLYLALVPQAHAEIDTFYESKRQGWFWKEPMPVEEAEQIPSKPSVAPQLTPKAVETTPPKRAEDPALSVAWLQKNLPVLRDRAIETPTRENILAYISAERVMRDKATMFSERYQDALKSAPWLDENTRMPASQAGLNAVQERVDAATDKYVAELARKTGLWFFYRSDCSFCKQQIASLQILSARFGFKILPIALDRQPLPNNPFGGKWTPDAGQAEQLGVTETPSLYLVKPPDSVAVLSVGLTPMDEIMARMVDIGAKQGWISPSASQSIRHAESPKLLKPSDASAVSVDRPDEIVAAVKRAIQGRK